ncbi:hypothetical protein TEA_005326 [Camellia sinensis var. sinensis]|uniref:Uncharacterized protein n=1 Tax=Camellia sinensis var. sinensis TaxID=542762 RepID=A0A4S4EFZ6_CAMSN|nr:hypothetical protein TEA_005326 [Camellia sinensis var. sinensis]
MTNYVRVMLREKEKEMGAGSLMNYAVEKSKELPAVVGNMGADLMGKAEEKWKELAPNMGGDLMGKVDEMFPPETIKEQIQRFIQHLIQSVFSCFGRGTVSGGKAIKMMIAPGTRGARVIVRSVFESNPAAYFSGLRGR